MAKVRVHPDVREATKSDDDQSPARRTRRQLQRTVIKDITMNSDAEVEDDRRDDSDDDRSGDEDDEGSSSLSSVPEPEPEPRPKARGRQRKSLPKGRTGSLAEVETPKPQLKKVSRQRGGNKRKHSHEYCLTCTHYGRACGGRREGFEGCAVCREPNKEKGEKLRECLWADPAAGIYTYQQAREIHKKAQAAERARVGKPPTKRQLQFLDQQESTAYLQGPDPLGVVDSRGQASYNTVPPPIRKPLNLQPPVLTRKQTLDEVSSSIFREEGVDPHNKDRRHSLGEPGQYQSPIIHKPQTIKLFVKDGVQIPTPTRLNTIQAPPPSVFPSPASQLPPAQQPTDNRGHRVPYFAYNINAWVLPAYPYSNLLSPHMAHTITNKAYISPYDAYPCIPIALSDNAPPRPILYQSGLPPPNTNVNLPRPQAVKPRPLDKTGKPVKKWARSNSTIKTVGGYEIKANGWASNSGSSNAPEHAQSHAEPANISNNAVSSISATGYGYANSNASSPLSSAVDVDETMADIANLERARYQTETVRDQKKANLGITSLQSAMQEKRKGGVLEKRADQAPEQQSQGNVDNASSALGHNEDAGGITDPDLTDSDLTADEGPLKAIPMRSRTSSDGSTIEVAPKTIHTADPTNTLAPARKRPRSPSSESSNSPDPALPKPTTGTKSDGWQAVNTPKPANNPDPQPATGQGASSSSHRKKASLSSIFKTAGKSTTTPAKSKDKDI